MAEGADIVESTVPLMDPAGADFQAMLAKAQTKAVEQLAVKDDTTMVEPPLVEEPKADQSLTPPDKPEVEEEPGDDIGNLKKQVTGLQAELSKVRKQKSGSVDEAAVLKERIAHMEGQMKVLTESKTTSTIEEKIAKLTDTEVNRHRITWEDERTDARVEARLAARENDTNAVAQANARLAKADEMLNFFDNDKETRRERKVSYKQAEADDVKEVAADLETFYKSVYDAVPEMNDETSEVYKAGLKEYQARPALMKRLGKLGELVAISAAISKNPELVSKKVSQKLVASLESVADKAFQKGGTAPSGTFKPVTTINSREDLSAFEAQVRAVKGG